MSLQLRVNPIACTGHGVCAELLPEVIELDPWGYPLLPAGPLASALEGHARRAVRACPRMALLIEQSAAKHR